ncbi:MAG TPA: flagellar biosynthetic protein FliQ [Acidimicrobiia bacterium]|nr:flagellar biosynthetic protein FliQ [Acidimicrobiia bacterium]
MDDTTVVHILAGAMVMTLKLAGPILAVCLIVGLVVAVLQTISQIQEMTLSFVPKLVGVGIVLIVGGPWMIHQFTGWVQDLWRMIPTL